MSGPTIEEIAKGVGNARRMAIESGRIQYFYCNEIGLWYISDKYNRSYVGKIYPGGRVELRGPIGDRVKKYLDYQKAVTP